MPNVPAALTSNMMLPLMRILSTSSTHQPLRTMKLLHISDLHVGRSLYKYNLGQCQREIFDEIIRLAADTQPDVMMIAGDIFDKAVPSGEAYTIFDTFLSDLTEALPRLEILIIAGNHDSAERLQ